MKKKLLLPLLLAVLLAALWTVPAFAGNWVVVDGNVVYVEDEVDNEDVTVEDLVDGDGTFVILELDTYPVKTTVNDSGVEGCVVTCWTDKGDCTARAGEKVIYTFACAPGYEVKYARFGVLVETNDRFHRTICSWIGSFIPIAPLPDNLASTIQDYDGEPAAYFVMPDHEVYVYVKYGQIGVDSDKSSLTIPESAGGSVATEDGRMSFLPGEEVVLLVQSEPNYTPASIVLSYKPSSKKTVKHRLTCDSTLDGGICRYKFNMPEYDTTITAAFSDIPTLTVKTEVYPEGAGEVSGGGVYQKLYVGATNTMATLIATPDPDWEFVNWTINGKEVETDLRYVFLPGYSPGSDCTVVANFRYTGATNYFPIWIGGTQVTKTNLSGRGWEYNPATCVLTLRNAYIDDAYYVSGHGWANIYIGYGSVNDLPKSLTIRLEGNNTLTGTEYGILDFSAGSITNGHDRSLTLTGGGSLTIKSWKGNIETMRLFIDGVTISAQRAKKEGIYTHSSLTIQDSTVNISADECGFGINADSTVNIQNSSVTVSVGDYQYKSFPFEYTQLQEEYKWERIYDPEKFERIMDKYFWSYHEKEDYYRGGWALYTTYLNIGGNSYVSLAGGDLGGSLLTWNISLNDSVIVLDEPANYSEQNNGRKDYKEEYKFGTRTYAVALTAAPAEGGTVTSDKEEAMGRDTVTLTVTPAEHWTLDTLTATDTDGNEVALTQNAQDPAQYSFTMPAADVSVSASFNPILYEISVNGDGYGIVETDMETAAAGENVTVLAVPYGGYMLDTLTVTYGENGLLLPTPDEADPMKFTFSMPGGNVQVNAVFRLRPYKISLSADAGRGTLTADKETATMGETVTLHMVSSSVDCAVAGVFVRRGSQNVEVTETARNSSFDITYSFVMPKGNVVVSGAFSDRYFVGFYNWNGAWLQWSEVEEGEMPEYTGPTPVTRPTDEYEFTFAGWDREITPVTGSASYFATYTAKRRTYTIRFVNDDGTPLQDDQHLFSDQFYFGETPSYFGETPVKPADAWAEYEFAGWTPQIVPVTGDATYTAVYTVHPKLKIGETAFSMITDEEQETSFVPPETGYYLIYSKGPDISLRFSLKDDTDTRYNDEDYQWYNPNRDGNWNFECLAYLEGGREYTVTLATWKRSGNISIAVEKKEIHAIHYGEDTENGVAYGPDKAYVGQEIGIYAESERGYCPLYLNVVDADGKPLQYNDENWTYTMADSDVYVTAAFAPAHLIKIDFDMGVMVSGGLTLENILDPPEGEEEYVFFNAAEGVLAEIRWELDPGYDLEGMTVTAEDGRNVAFNNVWRDESVFYTRFTMPAENVTVTCVPKMTHLINFLSYEGYSRMEPMDVAPGEQFTLPACEYIPEAGREFAGWQIGDDAENLQQPGDTVTAAEGMVILARWKNISFGEADFTLPAGLTEIEEEAFAGVSATAVYIPDGCTKIGAQAFRDCPNLTRVRIPAGCRVGLDVFDGCGTVYVFGTYGSEAYEYCQNDPFCVFLEEGEH